MIGRPTARRLPVAGVVLAGGQSRRMGRDKALIEVDGVPMAERVASTLIAVGCDPVVLYGGDVASRSALSVPVVPDRHPGQGPLGGVLGALLDVPGDDHTAVVIVSCDLPLLDTTTVESLLRRLGQDTDVVVARTDRLEPMCAVWSVRTTAAVASAFADGERALHRIITGLAYQEVPVRAEPLRNINTPDDLGG